MDRLGLILGGQTTVGTALVTRVTKVISNTRYQEVKREKSAPRTPRSGDSSCFAAQTLAALTLLTALSTSSADEQGSIFAEPCHISACRLIHDGVPALDELLGSRIENVDTENVDVVIGLILFNIGGTHPRRPGQL